MKLAPGVIKMVNVFIAMSASSRRLPVAGRHGNNVSLARILPEEEPCRLADELLSSA